MSRLTTWLTRELPRADARSVEVRDGDEVIARFAVERGDECEGLAAEIEEAFGSVESRSVYVVAVSKDKTDGASMTLQKASKPRAERSTSGFVATLLRDNEALRKTLTEQTQTVTQALLAENRRLAETNATLEQRRLEYWAKLEDVSTLQAERDLRLKELAMRDERMGSAMKTLREEWMPAVMQFLAGKAETRAGKALAQLFNAATSQAAPEFAALVAKLPAEEVAQLEVIMREVAAREAQEQVRLEAEKKRQAAPKQKGGGNGAS